MNWIQIFYGAGVISGLVLVYFFFIEFKKIVREKDDYDDKVDMPD